MNKKLKIILLNLLVIVIYSIISNFIEIKTFSFCVGASFIMILNVIDNLVGDSNVKD